MLVKNNILEAFVGLLYKFKTRNCSSSIQRFIYFVYTHMEKVYYLY